MIAKTVYTDLIGTSAADITDHGTSHNELNELGDKLGLDAEKLKLAGLRLNWNNVSNSFLIQLICIDRKRSQTEDTAIVLLTLPENSDFDELNELFKRMEIVLYDRNDDTIREIDDYEELSWSDYMK